ncbi:hypothetical protein J1N35_033355 [Gossypium stocksii]|uniref:DUF4283 domain-containing protein n=1 Tax=Gossypium stocksii TaxID=47602 RepID=A0A9D3UQ00_9ROSI|nr:hypothetical protein J1N35_033355 [Gossypium stocksii]
MGRIKFNVAGVVLNEIVACGGVLRDDKGVVFALFSSRCEAGGLEMAVLMAIKEAAEMVIELIWKEQVPLIIECDSKTLASLSIEEEEEAVTIPLGSKGQDGGVSYEHCFVGSFLTSSLINFPSMKVTLANAWHPIGGVSIFDLNEGRYLFRLYHKVDLDRIEAGGPWTFNSHLLLMHSLRGKEDPMVPLVTIDF